MNKKKIFTDEYKSTQEVKHELAMLKVELYQYGINSTNIEITHNPHTMRFRGSIEYND